MKHSIVLPGLLFIASTLLSLVFGQIAPVVATTTILVTTTEDELNNDADCSLREATRAANLDIPVDSCPAGSGADTILLLSGIYTLTIIGTNDDDSLTGDLDISSDLTIKGADMTTVIIDGNGNVTNDRVFDVANASNVTIEELTLRNGNLGWAANGGGILNQGAMTLTHSTLYSNTAAHGAAILNMGTAIVVSTTVSGNMALDDGGGIRNDKNLVIRESAIYSNTAGSGSGGGLVNHGTLLVVSNSTLSGNQANNFGGGVYYGNTPAGQPLTLILQNSTITNNTANTDNDNFGDGGGVYIASASIVTIQNTIIAGNFGSGNSVDCAGTLMSQGYNLIQSTTGCVIGGDITGNILNKGAKLGPLQNNGGRTPTHSLLVGSPAIDAGNPAVPGSGLGACEAIDQRGIKRPQISRCDIGSVEADNLMIVYLPIIQR